MTDTTATTTNINNDKNEIPNDLSPIRSRKRLQKSTSLQPSMRHNNNDMELAAEIGQGLLSEVRKMHSLLHQKQDSLMALEHEKVEQEHQIDTLTKQLKQKTDREDRMNEEIWDLELAKQELMQQVQDLSRDLSKSLTEQNKLVQQEKLASTELDQLHSQQILWNEKAEEYEQEIASLRRTITQLRREIKKLEQKHKQASLLTESHDNTKNNCSNMEEEKNGDQPQLPAPQQQQQQQQQQQTSSTTDTYTTGESIESGTTKNDQYVLEKLQLEISTLQNSLNHAHEIISVLEHDLKHERGDRQEISQLLQEAQETIEILQERHTVDDNDHDNDNEEKEEEKEEERVTRPPQREMSLGDELVSATNISWEIISLEPITNHFSPMSSLETISSSSGQLENKDNGKNHNGITMTNRSNKDYGTCVVRSNAYVQKNTPDDGESDNNTNNKQKRGDQALISPARASAFDFDPTFVKNQQDDDNDNSNLISSDSRATLTTNLVPAVTRTMIGDWMYKYTRKVVGSGISEKKHKRFFWIHPYTRTLYWSSQEPGVQHANGNKSALIISFQAIADGINPPSIMVQTPTRSLKVRCFDIMAHRAWVKALNYLVAEPSTMTAKGNCPVEPSGSLSMLFQPRFRSSFFMPVSQQQPAASRSLASIHSHHCSSSYNNSPSSRKRRHSFSRPFFEFSFSK